MWYVYIVECSDGTYYTGITNDLDNRIRTHNQGKGAKYTRARLPVKLVWDQQCEDRSAASKLEHLVKALKRSKKEALVLGAKIEEHGTIELSNGVIIS